MRPGSIEIGLSGLRPRAVLVAAVVVATTSAAGCGSDPPAERSSATSSAEQATDSLARAPYMGVSCPEPNSISCDRVGLAVWLREPAVRVEATIDGRGFTLDDEQWSEPVDARGRRREFAGFLQPAGLTEAGSSLHVEPEGDGRWLGRPPVTTMVELTIARGDGATATEEVTVPLSAGWG